MKTRHVEITGETPTRRASANYQPQRHDTAWFRWLAVLAVTLCALTVEGRECYRWVKRTDVGSYGQRWGHALAYDSDRGVTVFFGGERGLDGSIEYFDDTQEYDGKVWRQIKVVGTKPSPRSFHAMAYDPVNQRVVLFGGENTKDRWGSDDTYCYSDTWAYTSDGTNGIWTVIDSYNHNLYLARSGHAMVFNRDEGKIMVIAGNRVEDYCDGIFACFASPFGYVQSLEDGLWSDTFTNHLSYVGDWGAVAAYDDGRHLTVTVVGGRSLGMG